VVEVRLRLELLIVRKGVDLGLGITFIRQYFLSCVQKALLTLLHLLHINFLDFFLALALIGFGEVVLELLLVLLERIGEFLLESQRLFEPPPDRFRLLFLELQPLESLLDGRFHDQNVEVGPDGGDVGEGLLDRRLLHDDIRHSLDVV
jgi:hypothetical protein